MVELFHPEPQPTVIPGIWAPRPVVPMVCALISGIIAGNLVPSVATAAMPALACTVVLILYRWMNGRTVRPWLLFLFGCLGTIFIHPYVAPRFPENHVVFQADRGVRTVIGAVCGFPRRHINRVKLDLCVERAGSGPQRTEPAVGYLRVTVAGTHRLPLPGDRMMVTGKIRRFYNFNNPGGFDYRRYMAYRKIQASVFIEEDRLKPVEADHGRSWSGQVASLRRSVSAAIDRAVPEPSGAVLKALVVGDRQTLSEPVRQAFRRSGLGHLLAISGLHVGIVAAVAFGLFRWGLSWIPLFLWRGWTRKGAALLTFVPVVGYGLIAGMSTSTQRAVVMVAVFLVAILVDRESEPINTLAIAALLILAIHPPSLFSISFQLSFVAVLVILLGMTHTRAGRSFLETRSTGLMKKVGGFLLVSIFASIGVLPLVAHYFNQISLVGVGANLVAIPLVGMLAIPVGLSAVLLLPVSEAAAALGFQVSGFLIDSVLHPIRWVADMPYSAVHTVTPSLFEIVLYYLFLVVVFGFRRHPAIRIGAVAVVFLIGADICYWLQYRLWHRDMRVTVLDVGQGSCALLELPHGPTILIDGGGLYSNAVFDMGRYVVAPFLWQKKIRTIDTMVLSHPNADHLNGLVYVARNFCVGQVWTNGQLSESSAYREFVQILKEKEIPFPVFNRLPAQEMINGVRIEILHPDPDTTGRSINGRRPNVNNNSLVVRAAFGTHALLFPGDLMATGERELVDRHGGRLKSTFLLAPHHGSRSSSTPLFLSRVGPEYVAVSCGRSRRNFPHNTVIERLRSAGCRVYRTDIHGAIEVTTDGETLDIQTVLPVSE